MTTILPETVREALASTGQVAAELPCPIEGYREFVTVFCFQTAQIMGFPSQFSYLADNEISFRLMRFKVDAELIRDDHDFSSVDLVGLQSIYVATEQDVVEILRIWAVRPELLRQARETEVPI